jgi:hypothetical protein
VKNEGQATYDSSRDAVPDINPFEGASRERCAIAAGVVMARSWAPALLHVVVGAGYDEFERVYRPTARLHGFQQSDIKAIFELLVRTAKLNPVGSTHIEKMPQL